MHVFPQMLKAYYMDILICSHIRNYATNLGNNYAITPNIMFLEHICRYANNTEVLKVRNKERQSSKQ